MVPNGKRTAFYLLTCIISSQVLSAADNKIMGCFPIERDIAARKPITVNNRRANERWEIVLEFNWEDTRTGEVKVTYN